MKNVSNVLPVAMETSDVPESSPTVVSEENGSTTLAADPVLYPVPPPTEQQPSDFERLWKAAHDNPQDFTSWTDLLQYCEQEVYFSEVRGLIYVEPCIKTVIFFHLSRIRLQPHVNLWRPFLPVTHFAMVTGRNLLIWSVEQATTVKQRR